MPRVSCVSAAELVFIEKLQSFGVEVCLPERWKTGEEGKRRHSRHTHVLRRTVGRWSRQAGRDGGEPEKARAGFIGMCM